MEKHPDHCLNCQHLLEEQDIFCSACGQKADAHLLTVKELLSNFWNSVFNIDNTLISTLKYIWRPWKLTQFYVNGERRSYLNPMRLFIITLLFHFGIILSAIHIDNDTTMTNRMITEYERSKIFGAYLDLKNKMPLDKNALVFADSIEHSIFEKTMVVEKDTFNSLKIFGMQYPFVKKDILELPLDSVYLKYKIENFSEKLIVQQYIRIIKDQAGTTNYLIGNFAWGILLLIIALAGFMKIIYYRQKLHFVEHLVFLMNVHSLCFIVNSVLILIFVKLWDNTSLSNGEMNASVFIFPFVMFLVSLYLYYKQGIFKTLFKFSLIGIIYTFLISIFIILVSIVSLLIY